MNYSGADATVTRPTQKTPVRPTVCEASGRAGVAMFFEALETLAYQARIYSNYIYKNIIKHTQTIFMINPVCIYKTIQNKHL